MFDAVASKELNTELRGLTLEMLLMLYAGNKGLLLSNNVATSDKSTYTAVAGLTLSSLLFTSKTGYRNKWRLFTSTKNLSTICNAKFARKLGIQPSAEVWTITLAPDASEIGSLHANCSQLRMTWTLVQFHRSCRASQKSRKCLLPELVPSCVFTANMEVREGTKDMS